LERDEAIKLDSNIAERAIRPKNHEMLVSLTVRYRFADVQKRTWLVLRSGTYASHQMQGCPPAAGDRCD
jgi:hypothetical protein